MLESLQPLSDRVWTWVEMHGTGNRTCEWHSFLVRGADGALRLVDPLVFPEPVVAELEKAGPPAEVFLTSGWHDRDTARLKARWNCRIRAHERVVNAEVPVDEKVRDGEMIWGDVRACHLPFYNRPDDCGLFVPGTPGVLILGDALCGARGDIGIPDGELGIYRSRPIPDILALAAMLRRLLELPVGVIAFGHGKPLTAEPLAALGRFVDRLTAPVTICPYDPEWPYCFEALRGRVKGGLGDLAAAIEHVGSTAVPGLAAKPIIDLDVVVALQGDVPRAIVALDRLGYTHQGDLGVAGREAFLGPMTHPAHHLYLCAADSRELKRHLAFRDHLRTHPEEAARYAALKRELAERFGTDREGYTKGKSEFIEQALRRAGL